MNPNPGWFRLSAFFHNKSTFCEHTRNILFHKISLKQFVEKQEQVNKATERSTVSNFDFHCQTEIEKGKQWH